MNDWPSAKPMNSDRRKKIDRLKEEEDRLEQEEALAELNFIDRKATPE